MLPSLPSVGGIVVESWDGNRDGQVGGMRRWPMLVGEKQSEIGGGGSVVLWKVISRYCRVRIIVNGLNSYCLVLITYSVC